MNQKYYGRWSDRQGMLNDFFELEGSSPRPVPEDFPTDEEILFASYGGGSYDGDAFVLYQRDGKLYEVTASHCSCFGLEDQWEPEETSIEALAARQRVDENHRWGWLHDHEEPAPTAYWELVDRLAGQTVTP